MKKLLGIVVLGIGIVLSIPDKTFAATCQITLNDSSNNKIRRCTTNQILTVGENGVISRTWEMVDLETIGEINKK